VHELKELISLDPIAKVHDILLDYLTHDSELKEFIHHIQSEEFPKIHKIVEYMKKYKEMHMPVRLSSIQRGVYYSNFKIFNQIPQYIYIYIYSNILTAYKCLRLC
jgi:hypothetical protein